MGFISTVCLRRAMLPVALCALISGAGCAASPPGDVAAASKATGANEPPPGVTAVNAPKLSVGDVWVDRIRGQNREFRIEARRDDGMYDVSYWGAQMATDGNLNAAIYRSLTNEGSGPTRFTSAELWFAFPLYEGKTWDQTFKWETKDAMPIVGTTNTSGKVVGWEQVTVPAGTFRALKVEVSSRSFGKGGALDAMNMTYWYVPEVRRFVKFDYHSNYEGTVQAELVAYKPATGVR